jgi:hypothetical protein
LKRDIVVLALCAVMSGSEGWEDIEDWGREREGWLRQYLGLRNGIAGYINQPASVSLSWVSRHQSSHRATGRDWSRKFEYLNLHAYGWLSLGRRARNTTTLTNHYFE